MTSSEHAPGRIPGRGDPDAVAYAAAGTTESVRANRGYWDGASTTYLDEHGQTLGSDRLVWGPEGLDEDDARLLGDPEHLRGAVVLEVGCGAGQGARWATARGAHAVGVDLSAGMLAACGRLDAAAAVHTPVLQADARHLPLGTGSVDAAFSAYGALPFVADAGAVLDEVARVLRHGGSFVFSVTHPVRWAFPDDPGPHGLTADRSYFDRTPYTERTADGTLLYAEHHRTVGDWVRLVTAAGFALVDLVEPEWRDAGQPTWGGWSALRGALLPGTAIFCCRLPPARPAT